MNSPRIRLLTLLTGLVLALSPMAGSAAAQQSPPEQTPEQTAEEAEALRQKQIIKPKTEALKNTSAALREHLKLMREMIVRYNVTDDPVKARKIRREYFELMPVGNELHLAMIAAAVAEYRANPDENQQIVDMFERLIGENVDADRYEGLLAPIQALIENQYNSPMLLRQLVTTALAVNAFDEVEKYVSKLDDGTQQSERYRKIARELPAVRERWQRELELREKDSAGEPLPVVQMLTAKGIIEIELFENQAPEAVGNFIRLVEDGFYDNLAFHHVLEHFAVQGGCPDGDGSGDAGYKIYGESNRPDARDFFRGTIGMALADNNPDSAGSQFFITFFPSPELRPQGFTAFGRITRGVEVLGNLAKKDPTAEGPKKDEQKGLMADVILEATVISKRKHEYAPNIVQ